MEPPSKVPGSQLVWVQKHLHVELLKEENYLEVFATVSERALLKVRPLVAIVNLQRIPRRQAVFKLRGARCTVHSCLNLPVLDIEIQSTRDIHQKVENVNYVIIC